jgi:hypothetical protein
MKIKERCYSTKVIRPRPLVHLEPDGSLLVIANSWGQPEQAQNAMNEVVKYINGAKSDVEVTSPFEFLTCLSDEVNYARTGILVANEILYRGSNRNQYFSGVEILALFRRGNQVAWAQVGCSSIYLQRNQQRLQPLSVCQDLSGELGEVGGSLPPLPGQLMGLEMSCNVQCGSTVIRSGDQIILLSSSFISQALWSNDTGRLDLVEVTKLMIQDSPDSPFWLGIVEL